MKRYLIILILALIPVSLSAQSPMNDFFEDHSGAQGYQTIIYGKRMLDMMKDGASPDVKSLLNRYTFEYHNQKESVPGYDRFPLIFCIGPSTKNLNCFEALNLHHLPLNARIEFLIRFDKLSHFRDEDIFNRG